MCTFNNVLYTASLQYSAIHIRLKIILNLKMDHVLYKAFKCRNQEMLLFFAGKNLAVAEC